MLHIFRTSVLCVSLSIKSASYAVFVEEGQHMKRRLAVKKSVVMHVGSQWNAAFLALVLGPSSLSNVDSVK